MAPGGNRPKPPASIFDDPSVPAFIPAPDLIAWARETFISEGAILENAEHAHLQNATIAALWTNVASSKNG